MLSPDAPKFSVHTLLSYTFSVHTLLSYTFSVHTLLSYTFSVHTLLSYTFSVHTLLSYAAVKQGIVISETKKGEDTHMSKRTCKYLTRYIQLLVQTK